MAKGKMNTVHLLSLWLLPAVVQAGPYPLLTWDKNTAKDCTYWYDNADDSLSCKEVCDQFSVSPADFTKWNPLIDTNCNGWGRHSYCVIVKSQIPNPATTSTISTSTTTQMPTTTSSRAIATPTAWDYVGCYTEGPDGDHPLSNQAADASANNFSASKCKEICGQGSFAFMGLKANSECWCSSHVSDFWANNQDSCNAKCSGADSNMESCGGDGLYAVYRAQYGRAGGDPSSTSTSLPTSSATTTTTSSATTTTTSTTAISIITILTIAISTTTTSTTTSSTHTTTTTTASRAGPTAVGDLPPCGVSSLILNR